MDAPEGFKWHENAGARILLPLQARISQPFPELCAEIKGDRFWIMVTVTSHEGFREAFERMIRIPLNGDDRVTIRRLLEGEPACAYRGIELVQEIDVCASPAPPSVGWRRLLYLDDALGVVALFDVRGEGSFANLEPVWRPVVESFSWDPDSARVLRFDGDEKALREQYRRRPKKRVKAPPGPQLPPGLRYLQPAMDELSSVPSEDLSTDPSSFFELVEKAIRNRISGLTFEDAEELVEADREELDAWMEKQEKGVPAAHFIGVLLSPFIVYELMEGELSEEE